MKFKKSLVLLGVLGMMMSCTQSIEQDIISNASENLSVIASIDATKTVNNGDNTVSWVTGDKMSLLYTKAKGGYGNSIYTRVEGDTFSGEVSGLSHDKNDFYALYPLNEGAKTPKDVTFSIPGSQIQAGNGSQAHIAGANLPLYGLKTGVVYPELPVLPMHHVAAVVEFVITNKEEAPIKINEIKFTTPFNIVGDFSTDLTAESLSWKAKEAGKTITLTVADGEEIAPAGSASFYATVLPFGGEGEYKLEVLATNADGKQVVSEKLSSKNYEMPVGACTKINYPFVATGEVTVPAYVKVTEEPQSWDGVYIVVDDSAKQAFAIGKNGNKIAVTIDGDKVIATEDLAKYVLTVTDAKVKHANNNSLEAYNVRNADGKYIYFSSETIQIDNDNEKENSHDGNTYSYYHTFRYNGGGVEMMSSGHSSGFNKYYLGYSGGAFNYTDSASSRVQLYKLSEVTPSPVDPVDPDDPQPSTDKTYTKTNKIESGKAYVIVSSNNALKNASGSPAAYSVRGKISGETLTIPAEDVNSVEWVSSAASSSYSSKGDFTFTNNGVMFGRVGSNQDDIIFTNSASTRSVWSLDNSGDDLYQKSTSSSNVTLYMQYTSSKWTAESQKETNAIAVYVADASSPVPPTPVEPGDGEYYVELTSAPASWNGTYLVVAASQDYAFAINENNNRVQVTIDGNKIKATEALARYALTFKDAGIKHPNNTSYEAYNVFNANGKYIFYSNSTIQIADSNSKQNTQQGMNNEMATYYHTFSYDNGVQMMSSGNSGYNKYYLGYSSSKFNYSSGSSSNRVRLFKLDGESPEPENPGDEEEDDPTPAGSTFNLENSKVKSYLDAAATSYTNSNTNSIVTQYSSSNSATNRLDTPEPVTISWTGNATSISIYEGSSTSSSPVKTQSFTSSTSTKIYNLIPGKTYTYKVNNSSNTTGTFSTTGRRRMIRVSGTSSQNHANNCRDLGGITTENGKKLNYGLIYRGTNLDSVTSDEKAILVDDLGIKLDVDLRDTYERKTTSPLGVAISGEGYSSNISDLTTTSKIKATLTSIMTYVSEGKPVYIHCMIGSDRTGFVCMLIESLLGAPLKECDIDYELTSFASTVTYGSRTRNTQLNKDFRNFFIKNSVTVETVPEAVENYVVNTLGISQSLVNSFRAAMGVN